MPTGNEDWGHRDLPDYAKVYTAGSACYLKNNDLQNKVTGISIQESGIVHSFALNILYILTLLFSRFWSHLDARFFHSQALLI